MNAKLYCLGQINEVQGSSFVNSSFFKKKFEHQISKFGFTYGNIVN